MGAVENLITDKLPIWSSSVQSKSSAGRGTSSKRKLYGVKKLRELILDLAVRGLLVPQDSSDEPASVLLEKIAAEKERLIKDGEIKRQKPLPEIADIEKPYQLPQGWSWSYIGDIGNIFNGNSINSRTKEEKYSDGIGLPFIATKDIGYGFELINYDNGVNIPKNEGNFKVARKGIVFICAEGGSAGKKCGVTNQDVFFGNKLFASELFGNLNSTYILANYLSTNFYQKFKASMTGIIGGISLVKFKTLLIPIPPLAEQHRIVAKVDELMALCDTLEQQQEDSIQAHETLIKILLDTLTSAADADAFQTAWQRISDHFDVLFTTEHSIDKLKETVLQLAVMGKLVPQNPNDEPASVLLKKIAAEKDRLIKDGKIKKQKPLPTISDDEKIFKVPISWKWCRAWDISHTITSGSRDWAKYYSDKGAIFVTMGNLSRGSYKLRLDTIRYVNPPKNSEGKRTRLLENDLLISITGDVGNLGLIPPNFGEAYINQHTAMLRFMPECQGRFFPEVMRSSMAKNQFDGPQRGIKNSFRLGDLGEILIPLPPLAEQHRIVTKVDELMTLCDQLKESLQQAQQTQIHLTDAVVENAL